MLITIDPSVRDENVSVSCDSEMNFISLTYECKDMPKSVDDLVIWGGHLSQLIRALQVVERSLGACNEFFTPEVAAECIGPKGEVLDKRVGSAEFSVEVDPAAFGAPKDEDEDHERDDTGCRPIDSPRYERALTADELVSVLLNEYGITATTAEVRSCLESVNVIPMIDRYGAHRWFAAAIPVLRAFFNGLYGD